MNCAACDRFNDTRRRYCGGCGVNLQPICVRCGYANEAADRYCGGCGSGLTAAMSTHDADAPVVRRPLAVAPSAASPPPVPTAATSSRPRPPTLTPVPAPSAPVAAAPAAPAAKEGSVVSDAELQALLSMPQAAAQNKKSDLPAGCITQDDLDKLFQGAR